MKVTLDIDGDILEAAERISAETGCCVGEIISELARIALRSSDSPYTTIVGGFEILPSRGHVITPEFVRRFMDESETA